MKGAMELLGSTIIRQGKPYKVVGVTYNILGVWLQLERGRERLTIKAEEGNESEEASWPYDGMPYRTLCPEVDRHNSSREEA